MGRGPPHPVRIRFSGGLRPLLWTALGAMVVVVGACTQSVEAPDPVPVATVDVVPPTASIGVDERVQLTGIPRDTEGNALSDRAVTWESENPDAVTVDAGGLVTRSDRGTVLVRATSEGKSGTATITDGSPLVFGSLSLGTFHTCGVATTGAVYCWGENVEGQLGDGTNTNRGTPVLVAGGLTIASVSARGVTHSCGVTTDGVAFCWGSNADGQLGDGSAEDSNVPVPVTGGLRFREVIAERSHTCGVTTDGGIYCWGGNPFGELGDGSTADSPVPVRVASDLEFVSVGPGSGHTCGIAADGQVHCWGSNEHGQLGDATTANRLEVAAVTGNIAFASFVARDKHVCGVTDSGNAHCWGYNIDGQLGDGTTTDRPVPITVTGISPWALVTAGSYHTCGLSTSGSALCWGENGVGSLGNGTVDNSWVPVAVTGGHQFATLAAGCFHTCGVTTTGATYCWGRNQEGQLGDGSFDNSTVPIRVAGSP